MHFVELPSVVADDSGEPVAKRKKASILANTESTTMNMDRLKHFQEYVLTVREESPYPWTNQKFRFLKSISPAGH